MADEAQAKLAVQIEAIRSEQNLLGGIVAGLVGAIVGGAMWAAITAATEFQIGWMAIGIGFLVGIAMRAVGKGIEPTFGYIGAGLSLFGCALGNYLTVVWFVAENQDIEFLDLVTSMRPADIANLMSVTFEPMDLLFYGIAAYFGYRYSFRQIEVPVPAS